MSNQQGKFISSEQLRDLNLSLKNSRQLNNNKAE